jgi:hypothetical protein
VSKWSLPVVVIMALAGLWLITPIYRVLSPIKGGEIEAQN